jgi:hypothetical protein
LLRIGIEQFALVAVKRSKRAEISSKISRVPLMGNLVRRKVSDEIDFFFFFGFSLIKYMGQSSVVGRMDG